MKTKSVLASMAKATIATGAVGVVIVAPNSLQAIDALARRFSKKSSKHYASYAKRSGYFTTSKSGESYVITLTPKGKQLARLATFEDYVLPKLEAWNGKWHLLMYDISEDNKKYRDHINRRVKELGLKMVQSSIYVSPNDLTELGELIRETYPHVANHVVTAQLNSIDGDAQLRQAFDL